MSKELIGKKGCSEQVGSKVFNTYDAISFGGKFASIPLNLDSVAERGTRCLL